MAVVTVLLALVATRVAGVTFRDWEHAVGLRLAQMGCGVALLVVLDIVVRAAAPVAEAHTVVGGDPDVRRERWTAAPGGGRGRRARQLLRDLPGVPQRQERRSAAAGPAICSTVSWRASIAPSSAGTIRPRCCTASWARVSPREVLAVVYMAFFYFVLISLPLALVFSPPRRAASSTSPPLSINWVLGAASYLLLPARGPIYATPGDFADLPATDVTHLQGVLLRQRPSSSATRRRPTRIRASRPSPPCTRRSSSPPRLRRTCWGWTGACGSGSGSCSRSPPPPPSTSAGITWPTTWPAWSSA